VAPRILVQIKAVPVEPSGHVLVLHIPRSWGGPHMVTFKGHGKFYSRNSAGKYPMDVTELRRAFSGTTQIGEQIQEFRLQRVSAIAAGENFADLPTGSKIVLHACPFSALTLETLIDPRVVGMNHVLLRPLYADAWNQRFNIDGILGYHVDTQIYGTRSYMQVYRDGRIECVDTRLLQPRNELGRRIPSIAVEAALVCQVSRIFQLYTKLGIEPPVAIMLSLIGVKGFEMGVDPLDGTSGGQNEIDREQILLLPQIVDNYESDPAAMLRPLLDSLWNAAGFSGCPDYDGAGQPLPRLRSPIKSGHY